MDLGSGLGGAARFFARQYGCRVTGIDLTAEYVSVASRLTELVGLNDKAEFRVGSALNLPFSQERFDRATLLHVGMNIPDKDQLCREVHRVLQPGGPCSRSTMSCGLERTRSSSPCRGPPRRPRRFFRRGSTIVRRSPSAGIQDHIREQPPRPRHRVLQDHEGSDGRGRPTTAGTAYPHGQGCTDENRQYASELGAWADCAHRDHLSEVSQKVGEPVYILGGFRAQHTLGSRRSFHRCPRGSFRSRPGLRRNMHGKRHASQRHERHATLSDGTAASTGASAYQ